MKLNGRTHDSSNIPAAAVNDGAHDIGAWPKPAHGEDGLHQPMTVLRRQGPNGHPSHRPSHREAPHQVSQLRAGRPGGTHDGHTPSEPRRKSGGERLLRRRFADKRLEIIDGEKTDVPAPLAPFMRLVGPYRRGELTG